MVDWLLGLDSVGDFGLYIPVHLHQNAILNLYRDAAQHR